ncbi:MAG: SEC-C domain-containing protein [Bacilli bacterium]|nr:SEC-C domain-containing protein [Bacilli bacterium]
MNTINNINIINSVNILPACTCGSGKKYKQCCGK